MPGISAYGAYVPLTRLPLAMISGAKVKEGGPEKAVAYYDEDTITMAVSAAVDCLQGFDRDAVDALYFASTSYTLAEKQGAALIAKALDLRRDIQTQDFSGSLRCGTGALESALHAAAAGAHRNVMVIASDCRMGAPRGALEAKLGDGAAAFLVSADGAADVIATLRGSFSVADELQDQWRLQGERFTHSWEDRFVVTEGYSPNMVSAIQGALAKAGVLDEEISKAAIYAPDARSLGGVARTAGFEGDQLQPTLAGKLGNTGAAFAPMLFVCALEEAAPGQKILAASYGDGAHALVFETTAAIEKLSPRQGVSGHLAKRRPLKAYDSYLRSRTLDAKEWAGGQDLGLSATIRYRERDADISFKAGKCKACGTLQFPQPRVCPGCYAAPAKDADGWEAVRLSDKQGKLLAYTFDFFFPAAEPPTIMVMTEVEGARVQVQLANTQPDQVRLDMPLRYVFRKIHDAGGKANYFWKASPLDEAGASDAQGGAQ